MDLPLAADEWGSFDVVHARFVLEHVAEPAAVVRSMVHAARRGGRVILQDDDHDVLRMWPELPGVQELWSAYIENFRRVGVEPYVGRKLVALLHAAGARPRRNTLLFFGGCSGDPTFPTMVANFAGVLEGARESILANGLFDPDRFDSEIDTLRRWGSRQDAALWYTAAWAEGVRN
jgi:SAM-dependent methyltransferase